MKEWVTADGIKWRWRFELGMVTMEEWVEWAEEWAEGSGRWRMSDGITFLWEEK